MTVSCTQSGTCHLRSSHQHYIRKDKAMVCTSCKTTKPQLGSQSSWFAGLEEPPSHTFGKPSLKVCVLGGTTKSLNRPAKPHVCMLGGITKSKAQPAKLHGLHVGRDHPLTHSARQTSWFACWEGSPNHRCDKTHFMVCML